MKAIQCHSRFIRNLHKKLSNIFACISFINFYHFELRGNACHQNKRLRRKNQNHLETIGKNVEISYMLIHQVLSI